MAFAQAALSVCGRPDVPAPGRVLLSGILHPEGHGDNRTPVLFVHGTEDRFVPVSNTLRNYQACRAEKELLLVEGARHIQSYLLGGDQYREKLARFFEKYDCEEGGKQ